MNWCQCDGDGMDAEIGIVEFGCMCVGGLSTWIMRFKGVIVMVWW